MIAYIVKSSLGLIIFFVIYWLLLRKEKLFVFNRFFLLASLFFSLILPYISIPVNLQDNTRITDIIPSLNAFIPAAFSIGNETAGGPASSQSAAEENAGISVIYAILIVLYSAGVILFLIRFLKNLFKVLGRSKMSEKISFDGYRIVLTGDATGPFCFLKSVFLNRDDYRNGRIDEEMIRHEVQHARQLHSLDILSVEFIRIIYWFNPLCLLYDWAIRMNHEYLADDPIISGKSDIENYAEKLLKFATCRSSMPLTSGSNHSFTKNRLLMMSMRRSKGITISMKLLAAMVLIMVFTVFLSFKQSDIKQLGTSIQQQKVSDQQITGGAGPVPGVFENITFLVTFGKDAPTSFGDDDFFQVWYFSIPAAMSQQFYIRVFDPDCGGSNDEMQGEFNTTTRFSVYGGYGDNPRQNRGSSGVLNTGNYTDGILLAVKDFGIEQMFDDKYYSFGPFSTANGEYNIKSNAYLFKVVCEGISGDDGNLYMYFMSTDPESNIPVEGISAFTYEYTFRLWNDLRSVSHLYLHTDSGTIWIKQKNFDLDNDGNILIVSAYKQGLAAQISGEDKWAESRVAIEPGEVGRMLEFLFHKDQGRLVKNNNVTVSFENQYGEAVPILLQQ